MQHHMTLRQLAKAYWVYWLNMGILGGNVGLLVVSHLQGAAGARGSLITSAAVVVGLFACRWSRSLGKQRARIFYGREG